MLASLVIEFLEEHCTVAFGHATLQERDFLEMQKRFSFNRTRAMREYMTRTGNGLTIEFKHTATFEYEDDEDGNTKRN